MIKDTTVGLDSFSFVAFMSMCHGDATGLFLFNEVVIITLRRLALRHKLLITGLA